MTPSVIHCDLLAERELAGGYGRWRDVWDIYLRCFIAFGNSVDGVAFRKKKTPGGVFSFYCFYYTIFLISLKSLYGI